MASKGGDSAKVQRMRTIIAAGLGIAALIVAAVGLFFVLRPVGEVDAGQHFATLPAAERARTGEVVVTDYGIEVLTRFPAQELFVANEY